MRAAIPILLLLSALFFVWPIPHTISLRLALFFVSIAVFAFLAIKRDGFKLLKSPELKPLGTPLYLYAALTAWMLFGIFFISDHVMETLLEFKSQWLMGMLSAFLGSAVALAAIARSPEKNAYNDVKAVLSSLFFVLMLHVLILDAYAVYSLIDTGVFPAGERHRLRVLLAPDKMNYAAILALSMLLSETVHRAMKGRGLLPLGPLHTVAAYLLVFLSIYITGFRFGMITSMALILAALAMLLRARNVNAGRGWKTALVAIAIAAVLVVFTYSSYKSDARWQTFSETMSLALDPQVGEEWLYSEKFKRPRLEDGKRANNSNFYRVFLVKEGLKLVAEYPLGVGFSRVAFTYAIMKRYDVTKPGHTHSGLLDLALGVGIPGALLWCAMLIAIIAAAYSRLVKTASYPAIFLFFLTAGFTIRMITDSIIRDEMLQWFAFLVALSAVAAFAEEETEN